MAPRVAIHTFPVPHGMSAEVAWEAISRDEFVGTDARGVERPCGWANALIIDGSFKGILPADVEEAGEMVDREREKAARA